jgi:hypothetical protein
VFQVISRVAKWYVCTQRITILSSFEGLEMERILYYIIIYIFGQYFNNSNIFSHFGTYVCTKKNLASQVIIRRNCPDWHCLYRQQKVFKKFLFTAIKNKWRLRKLWPCFLPSFGWVLTRVALNVGAGHGCQMEYF